MRRMKKRATNRESARRMRALRKGEWASLLAEVDALRTENASLTARLAAAECGLAGEGIRHPHYRRWCTYYSTGGTGWLVVVAARAATTFATV
jgi:hypothetical protein